MDQATYTCINDELLQRYVGLLHRLVKWYCTRKTIGLPLQQDFATTLHAALLENLIEAGSGKPQHLIVSAIIEQINKLPSQDVAVILGAACHISLRSKDHASRVQTLRVAEAYNLSIVRTYRGHCNQRRDPYFTLEALTQPNDKTVALSL